MPTIIDLGAEFANLTMLNGRSPTTTDAEKKSAIAQLIPYRDGAIFASKFAGISDWERHPVGEEIVQIVDGATTMHLITPRAVNLWCLPRGWWRSCRKARGTVSRRQRACV